VPIQRGDAEIGPAGDLLQRGVDALLGEHFAGGLDQGSAVALDVPSWCARRHVARMAALGLVLPALTGIAVILTPPAAVGLILLAIAAVIAWGRFGPYAFWAPARSGWVP
jgi:hypothetical protein